MSEEDKSAPTTAPAYPCQQGASKPPICERYPGCIFFNDKMAQMPESAEATKDQFCRSDYPTCARYILQSIWKLKAPEDMYPYQMARAQAILDGLKSEQDGSTISTDELSVANRTIRLLINALGHGFMMFDRAGLCLPPYSKACETLLEFTPEARQISQILHLDVKQKETMQTALKLVFNQTHAMSFDEIMRFAPKFYSHSSGSIIKLVYKPDRLPNGALDRIVLIATDVTEQIHQQESAEERKALFESLEQIFRDRAFFGSHMRRLKEVLTVLGGQGPRLSMDELRREIHTLKGDAGVFKLGKIASALHDLETAMERCTNPEARVVLGQASPCAARVGIARDKIAAEIASLSKYLSNLLGKDITKIETERNFDKKILYAFANTLAQKGQVSLREDYIRTVCAESLQAYLGRYDAVVGDLAVRFNKKVKPIAFASEDVPVVVDFYRDLLDSFVHLFRNAIDHGIERPDDRQEAGKDPAAQITVSMKVKDGNRLCLEITDDGCGVDVAKLRLKLLAKDPDGPWSGLDDQAVLDALLTHNVSSRDHVSLYSGRGIGIGAVASRAKALGGTMKLVTQRGQGTRILLDVPYILDIPQT